MKYEYVYAVCFRLKAIDNHNFLWYEFAVVESVQMVTIVADPDSIARGLLEK